MAPARTTATPLLTERLTVPWWWWPLGLAFTALAALEIGLGAPGPRGWVPFAVLLPLVILALLWFSRLRLRVTRSTFQVDDAQLPLGVVADVVAIDAAGRRELLGPHGDPLAFVIVRPWIRTAVQVILDDPHDPTPYWLISTRRPVELAETLRAAKRTDTDAKGSGPATTRPDPSGARPMAGPAGPGGAGADRA
jgi:hypothetical protein